MPIPLNAPTTITIDKIRIEEFTVRPQEMIVTIRFSRGYEDPQGNFVSKEFDSVDIKGASFNASLYEEVKTTLYDLLLEKLSH